MGTRHLTVVIKDNKIKLSQYGQWDGYFNGQGEKFVNFCRECLKSSYKREEFKKKVDLLKQVDEKMYWEILDVPEKIEKFLEYKIPFGVMFPQFSRDTGADILRVIAELPIWEFNGKYFPVQICNDSGWCEFIYVLNLDTQEVYMLTDWEFDKHYIQETCDIIKEKFSRFDCWYKEKIEDLPDTDNIRKYNETIGLCNG